MQQKRNHRFFLLNGFHHEPHRHPIKDGDKFRFRLVLQLLTQRIRPRLKFFCAGLRNGRFNMICGLYRLRTLYFSRFLDLDRFRRLGRAPGHQERLDQRRNVAIKYVVCLVTDQHAPLALAL